MAIDSIDRALLVALQKDAGEPVSAIAERIGISQSQCWRRIRRLEEDGTICRRVALLDRRKANVPLTVFVALRTARHSAEWLDGFRRAISPITEVVEAWRLTGRDDYLIKLVLPDVEAYDRVYQRLIEKVEFLDVSASIAMEEMKFTTEIPTTYYEEK